MTTYNIDIKHTFRDASPVLGKTWTFSEERVCRISWVLRGTFHLGCTHRSGDMSIFSCFQLPLLPLLHVASKMTFPTAYRFYILGILDITQSQYNHSHQLTVGSLNLRWDPQTHVDLGMGGSPNLRGPQIYMTPEVHMGTYKFFCNRCIYVLRTFMEI